MSSPPTTKCESCGLDVAMSGTQLCPVCDPDVMALIESGEKSKTPSLCESCFKVHVANGPHKHE